MIRYIILLLATALLLASCKSGENAGPRLQKDVGSVVHLRTQGNAQVVRSKSWNRDGQIWIPVDRAAALLHYRYELNPRSHMAAMGFSDPIYTLTEHSVRATFGDNTIHLHEAPRIIDGRLCLETRSLSQLLQTPIQWDASSHSIIVVPQKSREPLRDTERTISPSSVRDQAVHSAKNKADEVIAFGKQFMGVPYLFSAGPYEQSHKFDCSSFMQYIFGHAGIDLPRSSVAQSTVGSYVTRDNLAPGDILFFYTPGRYRSNDIVGHVGLYMGNNQILQTYGDPGVTISSFTGDWVKRFMWGRRVW